ncbi:hypothetical protein H9P43_000766 [Blastocladiella emersonii ATCC 22665]|nr:hypothetical protein H9P43_000766 [Blastocladiella emersonii ATCC 22665]
MAKAGFFYCPEPDDHCAVRCFLCEKSLNGWDPDDDPFAEHFSHASYCAYARAVCLPTSLAARDPENPVFHVADDYSTFPMSKDMEQAREGTFTGRWPHQGKRKFFATKNRMAKAGFFFDPLALGDDGATCIYCGVSLNGWSPDDNPLIEHKKRQPDCPFFVQLAKPRKKRPAPPPAESKAPPKKRAAKAAPAASRPKATSTVARSEVSAPPSAKGRPAPRTRRAAKRTPTPAEQEAMQQDDAPVDIIGISPAAPAAVAAPAASTETVPPRATTPPALPAPPQLGILPSTSPLSSLLATDGLEHSSPPLPAAESSPPLPSASPVPAPSHIAAVQSSPARRRSRPPRPPSSLSAPAAVEPEPEPAEPVRKTRSSRSTSAAGEAETEPAAPSSPAAPLRRSKRSRRGSFLSAAPQPDADGPVAKAPTPAPAARRSSKRPSRAAAKAVLVDVSDSDDTTEVTMTPHPPLSARAARARRRASLIENFDEIPSGEQQQPQTAEPTPSRPRGRRGKTTADSTASAATPSADSSAAAAAAAAEAGPSTRTRARLSTLLTTTSASDKAADSTTATPAAAAAKPTATTPSSSPARATRTISVAARRLAASVVAEELAAVKTPAKGAVVERVPSPWPLRSSSHPASCRPTFEEDAMQVDDTVPAFPTNQLNGKVIGAVSPPIRDPLRALDLLPSPDTKFIVNGAKTLYPDGSSIVTLHGLLEQLNSLREAQFRNRVKAALAVIEVRRKRILELGNVEDGDS